jgi:LPS export ABC transporter protein LptC
MPRFASPRIVLIGMALALGIGLVYLIFVRELPRTEEQGQSNLQQTLDMTTVVMKQQRGDQVEWIVTSDRATYSETQRQAELHPVKFQVLNSGGKNPHPVDIQGTADSAFLDQDGQRVVLQGNTRVVSDRTLQLTSDKLEYQHEAGTIRATGHVEVRQDNALIVGDSADYSLRTEKLTLTAPRLYQ